MPRSGVALIALPLALAMTHMASAQRLRGRLLDLESNEPLAAGLVTLLASNGTSLVSAVTGADGSWVLDAPAPGAYYVSAKRIGYQPWVAGPVAVAPGHELSSLFHLRRRPVLLNPVEVSAQATQRYLELMGFYNRQRADFGHFITPEEIEKRQAVRVTDLLLGLPGVNLVSLGTGSAGALFVQVRGSNLSHGGVCRPRVYVDGLLYALGDSRPVRENDGPDVERGPDEAIEKVDQALSLDDIGHPSTIAAIELYRSASQVPVQFGGSGVETLCGVIVIWTHTGKARTER